LAQATATHPEALRRLLWGLISLGICVEGEDGRFALTPLGAYLRSGVPGSVRQSAIFRGEGLYQTWGHLLHSVQTGEPASSLVREAPTADALQRHPEVAATFHQSQTERTQVVAEALVGAYDFSRFGTLVDVGGGYGTLVLTILQAHPTLRGVVFDREHAMAGARQTIAAHGCTERCEAVAGDFFQAVPGGGDAYLLKSVLTNWDEARSTVILRNCRRATPPGAAPGRRADPPHTDRALGGSPSGAGHRLEYARGHREGRAQRGGISSPLPGGGVPPGSHAADRLVVQPPRRRAGLAPPWSPRVGMALPACSPHARRERAESPPPRRAG
jgi:O-methyltransferase domain